LRQWIHVHLHLRGSRMTPWKRLFDATVTALLTSLRRISTPRKRRMHLGPKYPRPVRFLKHADRWLQRRQIRPRKSLDFYRQRGNVDRMLQSWDATFAQKAGAMPVTRLELQPAPDAEIGKTCRWRIVAIEHSATRIAQRTSAVTAPGAATSKPKTVWPLQTLLLGHLIRLLGVG